MRTTIRQFQVVSVSLVLLCLSSLSCDKPRPNTIPASATAYLEAQKHFAAGEYQEAVELLNASIDQEPSPWAYFLRARVHLEMGDEAGAKADCDAGLQLAPGDTGLTWLTGELAKPAPSRFQGRFKNPPVADR